MTTQPRPGIVAAGFHDAECAGYQADLSLWLALAETTGGPVYDIGSGTGRVSLPLATAGFEVVAIDLEADLLAELERRAAAQGVTVRTAAADMRTLGAQLPADLPPAALVLIPMQSLQLVGGSVERHATFKEARALAAPGAEMAVAIVGAVEPFDARDAYPSLLPPDIAYLDGFRFDSTPLAVLQDGPEDQIDMHRKRVVRDEQGAILGTPEDVVITLQPVTVPQVQAEAVAAGWSIGEVIGMAPTDEHAGGTVVTFVLEDDDA